MADLRQPGRAGAKRKGKGKVLKVRLGYNANSSSLSAIVSMLLLGSAAAATVMGMISAALFSREDKGTNAGAGDGR